MHCDECGCGGVFVMAPDPDCSRQDVLFCPDCEAQGLRVSPDDPRFECDGICEACPDRVSGPIGPCDWGGFDLMQDEKEDGR